MTLLPTPVTPGKEGEVALKTQLNFATDIFSLPCVGGFILGCL